MRAALSSLKRLVVARARTLRGRLLLNSARPYMKGAYATYEAALASQPAQQKTGYDHDEVVEIETATMSTVRPWDYPVLFWLDRLLPQTHVLIDAGGHIGTKYRAFRPLLRLPQHLKWIVLDLPAVVKAGRARAAADQLSALGFESDAADLPEADLLLASGLMQYYPGDLSALLAQLKRPPRHLLVNKVALREGPAVFTMERIGPSRVPYQIRNRSAFLADVERAGYELVDQWDIPSLAHEIETHPELGASQSRGFYFRLVEAMDRAAAA